MHKISFVVNIASAEWAAWASDADKDEKYLHVEVEEKLNAKSHICYSLLSSEALCNKKIPLSFDAIGKAQLAHCPDEFSGSKSLF